MRTFLLLYIASCVQDLCAGATYFVKAPSVAAGRAMCNAKANYNTDCDVLELHPKQKERSTTVLLDALQQWRIYYATSSRSERLSKDLGSSDVNSCLKRIKRLVTNSRFMLLQATFQIRLTQAIPLCCADGLAAQHLTISSRNTRLG